MTGGSASEKRIRLVCSFVLLQLYIKLFVKCRRNLNLDSTGRPCVTISWLIRWRIQTYWFGYMPLPMTMNSCGDDMCSIQQCIYHDRIGALVQSKPITKTQPILLVRLTIIYLVQHNLVRIDRVKRMTRFQTPKRKHHWQNENSRSHD